MSEDGKYAEITACYSWSTYLTKSELRRWFAVPKAWEIELEMRRNAYPKIVHETKWTSIKEIQKFEDALVKALWYNEIAGSGAPERLMVEAVQAAENKGLRVDKAERLLLAGLQAWEQEDIVSLHRITSCIWKELQKAPPNYKSEYWNFKHPQSWKDHKTRAHFPAPETFDIQSGKFEERIYGGWLAQICGGALGSAFEGYVTDRLLEAYGEITYYVRQPETINDDLTYELAFLKAFEKRGYQVKSDDIAEEWIAHIPFGWSAEYIALNNLKLGIFPPESGRRSNPFSEWIGAQMRGAVIGMVAPGNPFQAARLAWVDGVISHQSNGVLGEVFNAVLVAMAFVETDLHRLIQDAIRCIPKDSQYRSVVETALEVCKSTPNWLDAWKQCEHALERYAWAHAYPNAAAEVVALWYGNGNFDKTMSIIAMAGQDVDCNAAQIATVLGVMFGPDAIGKRWSDPIHDELNTYMRGMEKLKITELARWTTGLVRKHWRLGFMI